MLSVMPVYLRSLWRNGSRYRRWFRIGTSEAWLLVLVPCMASPALPVLAAWGKLVTGGAVHMAPAMALPWAVAALMLMLLSAGALMRLEHDPGVAWAPLLFGPSFVLISIAVMKSAARLAAGFSIALLWIVAQCLALAYAESAIFLGLAAAGLVASLLLLNPVGLSPFIPSWLHEDLVKLRLDAQIDANA